MISRLIVKNYKILKDINIEFNQDFNVFVGQNGCGKSTVLEALNIATTGKLNRYPLERQLRPSLFNNECRKEYIDNLKQTIPLKPPVIVIEIYFDQELAEYKGTNNSLRQNCSGIRVEVALNDEYSDIYKAQLKEKQIDDIPVEFYKVTYKYFNGADVLYRFTPVRSVLVDASHKDYSSVVNRFINVNVSDILTDEDQIDVGREYRRIRTEFSESENIKKLNAELSSRRHFDDKKVKVNFSEENVDAWKDHLSLSLENVPFDNIGFGLQNAIKTELAIEDSTDKVNVLLMEEPENNLSYTYMAKLISHIRENKGKQIFITTHSSYIANKLSLDNLILMNSGMSRNFASLSDETKSFFQRLPGYDTLRVILAEKVILVEGPTDELIVERAYKDQYGHLPIDDGIDVIVAGGLLFKRFMDLTIPMDKLVYVITDNDGDVEHIKDRYTGYYENQYVKFFVEQDNKLHTIEPSVLNVNSTDGIPEIEFQHIVHLKQKKQMKFNDLDAFMENNKVDWAIRVFDSEKRIKYPQNIMDAIKEAHG